MVRLDSLNEIVVSSPEARPSGGVAIRSFRGTPFVLWSDARQGRRSIYARKLSAGLLPVGVEWKVCDGAIAADSTLWLLDRGVNGALLIWDQPDGSGRIANLDGGLSLAAGRTVVTTSGIASVHVLPRLGDALLLVGKPGSPGHFIHADGTLDARDVPEAVARRQLVVNQDTSVGVARGTSVVHFPSLFDPAVAWTREVAASTADYLPIRILTTDSLGNYLLYFSGAAGYRTFWIPLYRARLTRDGMLIDLAMIDSLQYVAPFSSSSTPYPTLTDARGVVGCGASAVSFTIGITWVPLSASPNITHSINADGFIVTEGGAYIHRRESILEECGQEGRVVVTRTVTQASNTFLFPQQNVRSYTHIAHGDASNTAQTTPMIVGVAGENLILTYQEPVAEKPEVLASWKMGSSDRADIIDTLGATPIEPRSATMSVTSNVRMERSSTVSMAVVELQSVDWTQNSPYQQVYSDACSLWLPTREAWKKIAGTEASSTAGQPQCLAVVMRSADGKRTLIASNFGSYMLEYVISCVDDQGSVLWSCQNGDLTGLWGIKRVIPLEGHRYLLFVDQAMLLMDSSHLVRKVPWADSACDRYWPLRGERFLRIRSSPHGLHLEIFNADGASLHSATYEINASINDIAVVEHDRAESIAIAAATTLGLRGLFLTENLMPLHSREHNDLIDVRLSQTLDSIEHPSMTIAGDRLVIVWEDYRDGAPAIYGAVYTAAEILRASDRPPGPPEITISSGSGADGLAHTIGLERDSEVEIGLFDPIGTRLLRVQLGHLEAGMHKQQIDVGDVRPGAYFVTAAGSGGLSALPIVITRR